jgi:hypothetical protein
VNESRRRSCAASQRCPVAVGDHVAFQGIPAIVGVVAALSGEGAKVCWSEHTSTWTAASALVLRGRRGRRGKRPSGVRRRKGGAR